MFADENDYDKIDMGDTLVINEAPAKVNGQTEFTIEDKTKNLTFRVRLEVSDRLKAVLIDGGLLNHTKNRGGNG